MVDHSHTGSCSEFRIQLPQALPVIWLFRIRDCSTFTTLVCCRVCCSRRSGTMGKTLLSYASFCTTTPTQRQPHQKTVSNKQPNRSTWEGRQPRHTGPRLTLGFQQRQSHQALATHLSSTSSPPLVTLPARQSPIQRCLSRQPRCD